MNPDQQKQTSNASNTSIDRPANSTNPDSTIEKSAPTTSTLPFTEIPRTSRLFGDYLYQHDKVADFYRSTDDRAIDKRALVEYARRVAAQPFERDAVADALTRQNRRFGSSELTFRHIELLRQPETVAVVTGQQASLFTGPLFTIYKALTAIKLAAQLREQGITAVPVFWVASEDHDYAEVDHCRVVNRDGQLMTIRYDACWPTGARSVGEIELCEEIETQIEQLFSCLPESEFIPQLRNDLADSYQIGVGFAEAFARLMAKFFAKYGVVLLDPQDEDLKRLAARIYEPALRNSAELAERLVERSQALESAGYHAQVYTSSDMVPLFLFDGEQRSALVRNGDCFTLKATSQCRMLPELLEEMATTPAHFSPSVALRPVVQDWLLPTIAYAGGPAEIAYFAQLQPVYRFFERLSPILVARASITIVQERFQNVMKKYDLKFEDLFAGSEAVMRKVIEGSLDPGTTAAFDETEAVFQAQLDRLRDSLEKIDATLAEALKGSREKIFYQLQNLRTRYINSSAKREETAARQIERLLALLYPDKNLQERELSGYYFLARYGYQFIDMIYQSIDTSLDLTGAATPNHKLLYI